MTTTSNTFFSIEQNAAVIRNFATVLPTIPPLEPPHPEVVKPLTTFFVILSQNLAAFDEYCPANIEWLGQRFVDQLSAFMKEVPQKRGQILVDIFTISYRFLCELEFSQPGELSFELRGVKNFAHENLDLFQGPYKQQIIYASYVMPASLTRRILQHSSLSTFKDFADNASAAKMMKDEWDKEIASKKAETDGLLDAINRLQTKYNFVGLVKGFEVLASKKKTEATRAFLALLALGGVMIIPVCIQLGFVLYNVESIDIHRTTLVYSLPPLLALEFILLYFFRVVLANFRSLQSQLLQLDLRVSLCQFIQSYAEYSTKIKKIDSTALERFESIVFSAVTPDAEKMPATFDGLENLARLVSSMRGK